MAVLREGFFSMNHHDSPLIILKTMTNNDNPWPILYLNGYPVIQ